MKLSAALPVCLLLALASALEVPKPCTPPELMEGQIGTFYPRRLQGDYGMFSYDAKNERIYAKMFMNREGRHWQQVDLLLFQKEVLFQFFPGNGTCVKFPLHTPFPSPLLPKNATFAGKVELGTTSIPHAALQINCWAAAQEGASYTVMTTTDRGCLPQWWATYDSEGWFSKSFFNITLGIIDPSVFTPPPQCLELL